MILQKYKNNIPKNLKPVVLPNRRSSTAAAPKKSGVMNGGIISKEK
jgi:hypothetical protein